MIHETTDDRSAADAAMNLGADLVESGDLESAIASFTAATELYMTAGLTSDAGDAYANRADARLMVGQPGQAIRDYHEAVQCYEDSEAEDERQHHINLALCATGIGNADEALGNLSEAHASYLESERCYIEGGDARGAACSRANIGDLLYLQGRLQDALSVHDQTYEEFAQLGLPRDMVRADNGAGNVLSAMGRYDEAVARFERARAVLCTIDAPRDLAACESNLADTFALAGQHDKALRWYASAQNGYVRAGDRLGEAQVDVSLAILASRIGLHQEALERYEQAHRWCAEAGATLDAARCEVGLGAVFWRLGKLDEALKHYRSALDVYGRAALSLDEANCHLGIGIVLADQADIEGACIELREARRRYGLQQLDLAVAHCDHNLGCVLAGAGQRDISLQHLEAARLVYDSYNLSIEVARSDDVIGLALQFLGRFKEAAHRHRQARKAFAAAGMSLDMANAEHNLAAAYQALGRTDEARSMHYSRIGRAAALRALAIIDGHRYDLRRPDLRQRWVRGLVQTLKLALEMSLAVGDTRAVAELIEIARAQALPDLEPVDERWRWRLLGPLAAGSSLNRSPIPSAMEETRSATRVTDQFPATGDLPLTQPGRVFVRGTTCLRRHCGHPGLDVSLELVCAKVAGVGAWWWGMWASGDRLWWSVVPPQGELHAGYRDLAVPGDANLLDELAAALPLARDEESTAESVERALMGALGEPNLLREGQFAWRLGRALLPKPLLDELLRRCGAGAEPLLLAVAPSSSVARVPFALLALEEPRPDVDARRVLEAAVMTYTPPAYFVHTLAPPAPLAGPGALQLVVADPTDDLPMARRLPDLINGRRQSALSQPGLQGPESMLLGGRRLRATHPKARLGDREGVVEALREIRHPGRATAAFIGHALPATAEEPARAALLLAAPRPGEPPSRLSASDLLLPDDRRRFIIPRRVLVAACSSSGAERTEGGEWWGLAPALLWAGAKTVVATLWDLLDTLATTTIAADVAGMLESERDPARGLRELQLAQLAGWRSGENGIVPLHWAPWVTVGLSTT